MGGGECKGVDVKTSPREADFDVGTIVKDMSTFPKVVPSAISPCATWESAISPEGSFADEVHGSELLDFTLKTSEVAIVNKMR